MTLSLNKRTSSSIHLNQVNFYHGRETLLLSVFRTQKPEASKMKPKPLVTGILLRPYILLLCCASLSFANGCWAQVVMLTTPVILVGHCIVLCWVHLLL